jgi:inorganic pyrophosphatase
MHTRFDNKNIFYQIFDKLTIMNVHDVLAPGTNPPEEINAVIEIPKGSSIKYEIDAESGMVFVDRKLFTAMFYPCNYGFIPQSREDDGDPVDVLVLGNDAVIPMSVIRANPIGILLTEDEEGQDSKVVAVPIAKLDPSFSNITNINNVPEHTRNEIKHFFEHYKELEKGKYVKVKGWEDKEVANRRISEAIDRYRNNI